MTKKILHWLKGVKTGWPVRIRKDFHCESRFLNFYSDEMMSDVLLL